MKRVSLLFSFALANALSAQAPIAAPPGPSRAVDLAICLDISGSMDGLLNAARQNLWAVVNELATLQPAPSLRVALLTFGCTSHEASKGWVRVETPFTTDLDTVSQKLFALTTNGGDEYVARVMQAALELEWSSDPQALKLMFVAGNESATQDPAVDGPQQSRAAIARGVVVNSIYCGNPADQLAPAWREVSKLADGQFATIQQENTIVITTPFDTKLIELSTAINATYVPFGKEGGAWALNQGTQDSNAAGLNSAAAAQRCQTKGSGLYWNAHWDLVDACRDPKFKLEDVKAEDLPEAVRAMSAQQRREHVAAQQRKRDELKKEIEAVGAQRDAFVVAERKKLGAAGDAQFDSVVLEAVRRQAEARGFHRAAKPAPAALPATKPCESPFVATVKAAVEGYRSFALVTGSPRVAPTDCRLPAPYVRLSAAEKEHGGKLYLLYARFADGKEYVKPGEPAKVGQTLVKEAWVAVPGEPKTATEAGRRYMMTPVHRDGDVVHHASDAAGLFVMHKLAADTPDTDQGWVYATIDARGEITAAGRIASCMRCHQDTTEDRRFGLR